MRLRNFLKTAILLVIFCSLLFPLYIPKQDVEFLKLYSDPIIKIHQIDFGGQKYLNTKSASGPFQFIIDDMEDVTDWDIVLGTPEVSLSTNSTQGSYSMNITYPCNPDLSNLNIIIKNLTSLNINFSKYDTLEFDVKYVNIAPFAFTICIENPPVYDTAKWYRNILNDSWQHIVIDLRYFQQPPIDPNAINYDSIAFFLTSNMTTGSNVTVLIDNLKVCGTGIRLSTNLTYSDVSEGETHSFAVNISRLLGTGNMNYALELDRTNLVEFQASLSDNFVSLSENGSSSVIVNLTAPDYASIDSTESVILWIKSTSDPRQNHSIELIAGVKRNLDKIYFISDIDTELHDIYSINPDGTNITRLTDNNYYEEGPLTLSSSGKLLGFTMNHSFVDLTNPSAAIFDIWILNLTDMTLMNLSYNDYHEIHVDFAPNETHISFNSDQFTGNFNYSILTMKLDGQNLKKWSNNSMSCWDIAWSHNMTGPDLLAYCLLRNISNFKELDIYLLNLTDNTTTRLTNDDYTETDPYFSADDTCLLFDRYLGPGQWHLPPHQFLGLWSIYEYNLTNFSEISLYNATGIATFSTYSPDNSEILFTQYEHDLYIKRLMIMNRDGSNPRYLKYLDKEFNMWAQDWGPRREPEFFPDAEIVAGSMQADKQYPRAGDSFKINISIKNIGEVNISSINVSFYLGFPNDMNNLIDEVQMVGPINISDTINVSSASITIFGGGNFTFYALLLCCNPKEHNTSNNIYSISIFILSFFIPIFSRTPEFIDYRIIIIEIAVITTVALFIIYYKKKKKQK